MPYERDPRTERMTFVPEEGTKAKPAKKAAAKKAPAKRRRRKAKKTTGSGS